jgi:ABC-type Mn2+/Zn2+ transport system ATPase subunit
LFDEPFNALDEDGQSLAKTLIKEWVAKRKTILFVDHNKARSHELSSRQIILSGGHIQKENQA